ncbi:hypothetical protein CONPUDRAFT_20846, partial [Coniophora puteana RWD-64-598 SS2]
YAMFSHRLGPDEPTYADFVGRVPGKVKRAGYAKLQSFCKKAREIGCDFAWSDTCCIQAADKAELEEETQSIFRWHTNSHVCIAYLSDSNGTQNMFDDTWFKRSWTLQDLLGPDRLKLYGSNWGELFPDVENDKAPGSHSLKRLSEITHIPAEDIAHFKPGTDRISEKMMWAARRRTTRAEDVAYSLIGIFDVSIPIIYGEGERAFFRLMEAIIQRCNHWDIFAW